MLQSVSAHLMDERRLSRLPSDNRGGSRYSRRATLADALGGTHLCPPHWYGIGVIEDFQPSILTPSDSSLGWAMFNTLPIRPPSQRLRNRHVVLHRRSAVRLGVGAANRISFDAKVFVVPAFAILDSA
ncbi:unnamed protein product [Heligmosomoides polygyrus]|uniref:Uncharacterized protein n=1 Tax=Heligmosomoides polygyrus TaxID=6339 RepID=A0A183FV34_HELPZ|nr:unnamed protein product [Heligmosomoides polygyrus]